MGKGKEILDQSKISEEGDYFLTSDVLLCVGDAVGALITMEDGSYLMQLRDQKEDIFYPGHWGLFGGAVDEGEDPLNALYRELNEELNLEAHSARLFTRLDIDLKPVGLSKIYRIFYETTLTRADLSSLVLREGTMMKTFDPKEILSLTRVVPYDAFVLWLHIERNRLRYKSLAKEPG
jgi:8-oxo-dGTP pyrophosphatase MutT (NUDIX family)